MMPPLAHTGLFALTAPGDSRTVTIIVGVFVITFVVVCVVAYLFLASRRVDPPPAEPSSAEPSPAPPVPDRLPLSRFSQEPVVSPSAVPKAASRAANDPPATPAAVDPGRALFALFYRALMTLTGLFGLAASALMASAATSLGRLIVVAFAIAVFSLWALYRGLVSGPAVPTRPRDPS